MSQSLQQELNALYNEVKAIHPLLLALGERVAVLEKAAPSAAATQAISETIDVKARSAIDEIDTVVAAIETRVAAIESMDFEGLAADAVTVLANAPQAEPVPTAPPAHEPPGPSAPTFDAPAASGT